MRLETYNVEGCLSKPSTLSFTIKFTLDSDEL